MQKIKETEVKIKRNNKRKFSRCVQYQFKAKHYIFNANVFTYKLCKWQRQYEINEEKLCVHCVSSQSARAKEKRERRNGYNLSSSKKLLKGMLSLAYTYTNNSRKDVASVLPHYKRRKLQVIQENWKWRT